MDKVVGENEHGYEINTLDDSSIWYFERLR